MNTSLIEARIQGTASSRFWQEFFGNSAHFPIAIILYELLIEGAGVYLVRPDLYVVLPAGLIQAYFLSRWKITTHQRRFLGNLIAPALYTLVETVIEGIEFFADLNHLAYWGFAIVIGGLEALRLHLRGIPRAITLILENVVRANILLILYAFFEAATHPEIRSIADFWADSSHRFITLAIPLLGLSIGLAELVSQYYQRLLRHTSAELKIYSEWLLGRDLLNRMLADPHALTLKRTERTILFMDIRGFTSWSEAHSPEEVVALLDQYYQTAESVLNQHQAARFKLNADEVMAVFVTAEQAIAAAQELRTRIQRILAAHALGVGIGLHTGLLVEGLLGSTGVKFYDVIGDTVNTAQRIETRAVLGEILVSASTCAAAHGVIIDHAADRAAVGRGAIFGAGREITVKGKATPLVVYPLSSD